MSVHIHAADDLFESFTRRMFEMMGGLRRQSYYHFSRSVTWEPAVNIQEDEACIYLCVELPGLEQDEITVEAMDRSLRIRGERGVPRPPGKQHPSCIVHMEINSGRFERIIKLPDRADLAHVEAMLHSGFLWITIPKKAE